MIVANAFHDLDLVDLERTTHVSSLLEAGLWPDAAPSLWDWCAHAELSTVRKQAALLEHVITVTAQATKSK